MSDQLLPVGKMAISQVRDFSPPVEVSPKKETVKFSTIGFRTLEELEIEHIERALVAFDKNKSQVAIALGITTKTLYNKLHAYGLFEKYQSIK
jgi:DNA-binding NtrC family response regulator